MRESGWDVRGREPCWPSRHRRRECAGAYTLYTHCGIYAVQIERWLAADHPLSDGSGNPPPGRGDPEQPGTVRMLSATAAEFRDSLGHVVRFHLRAGAAGPKKVFALSHRAA